MSRPFIQIHNATTNEIINREMNDEEFAQHQADEEARLSRAVEEAARAEAKAALLDKLGITEDEAKLLLGGN